MKRKLTIDNLPNDILKYELLLKSNYFCRMVCKRWYLLSIEYKYEKEDQFYEQILGIVELLLHYGSLSIFIRYIYFCTSFQ